MMDKPDQKQLDVLKNMSGAEKIIAAMKLRDEAIKIKTAAVKMQHSDWSEEQVKDEVKRIFLYART